MNSLHYNYSKSFYCNNCGQYGHSFHKCNEPITSLGIICFRYNQEAKLEFLCIRRKDSMGFVDLIRGKYNIRNLVYLQNIVDEMTLHEKHMILTKPFQELWSHMWNYRPDTTKYRHDMEYSLRKFDTLKKGIRVNDITTSLEDMVHRSTTKWNVPEWGFPKGRRNYKENDLSTAYREFQEETGLKSEKLSLIKNILPMEEIFIGSNFKAYRSKYFICHMKYNPDEIFNPQDCEVGDIGWHSLENITTNLLRNTQHEKIKVLQNVNDCIQTSKILF